MAKDKKKKKKIELPATTRVISGVVRLTFVRLFKPEAFEGNEPKYSALLIIDKSDKETLRKIKGAIALATKNGLAEVWNGKEPRNLKNPLKKGDVEFDIDEHPEYEDTYVLKVSSKYAPQIVDRYKEAVTEDDGVLKSGDYARVSMNFFPYSTAGNKGVSAVLNNVQYIKAGESLGGGRVSASDDFDEFETDDDFDDDDE